MCDSNINTPEQSVHQSRAYTRAERISTTCRGGNILITGEGGVI